MLTIKSLISQRILAGVEAISANSGLDASTIAQWLEYPPDVAMGDLAFPCFRLSKTLRRSPVQIAGSLADTLNDGECPCIQSAENVNGYLNIRIAPSYLAGNVLPEILEKKEAYGAPNLG